VIHRRSAPGADPGICVRGRPLSSPLPFPLEVGSPLNQLRGLGDRCKLPQRGPGRPKMNFVHSKAVRKPLVASFLVFWSAEVHVLQLSLIRRRSVAQGGGSEPDRPPLNPPLGTAAPPTCCSSAAFTSDSSSPSALLRQHRQLLCSTENCMRLIVRPSHGVTPAVKWSYIRGVSPRR